MGLLHQLWDDTVAGPPPLGKLRKYDSFSPSTSSSSAPPAAPGAATQITCSISVVGTPVSWASSTVASSPRSPASAPESPLTPTGPWGEWRRLRRKPMPAAAEGTETAEPRAPTVYDWVVISSLDR